MNLKLPIGNGKFVPDQAVRLTVILVISIIVYFGARIMFVPETFGDEGHFRAASITEIESLPISYAGESVCYDCHDGIAEEKNSAFHRDISCETCHGPGSMHADEDPELYVLEKPATREFCTLCHAYNNSRPTGFPQVDPMLHNPTEACTECHNSHDPTPPEVPQNCSGCHGQIARTITVSAHTKLDCETCHEANENHMTSPRQYIPTKPRDRNFCAKCHSTEADVSPAILKVDFSSHEIGYACWQCHYPHFPEK